MRHDSILAATYIDVADMNILEIWQEFLFYRDCLLLGTYVVVKIGSLESDSIACNIGHVDMVDINILALTASFHSTLESQSGICALEGIVSYNNVFHTAREFATDYKTAMSMVYGVVLDVDILAWTRFHASRTSSALHADTVIASINYVVDNQYVFTT